MELKRTITSVFMVPTLGISRDTLSEMGFINGYSKQKESTEYENCIFLLFKPPDIDKFNYFVGSEHDRTKYLISDIEIDGFYILVYFLEPKFKKDFELVRKGKYSHTSKEFQELFPKVLKVVKNGLHKDQVALQYRIFNKTNDLVEYWEDRLGVEFKEDMEVWDTFNEDDETLDLTLIKEKYDKSTSISK